MSQFLSPEPTSTTLVKVPLALRQQVWRRLQELSIPAWCTPEGHLRVSLELPSHVMQVWSVIGQHRATRSEQLNWLERCWDAEADTAI
ncbi:MAG: Asr1405/Asl0597 family protein [Cyanophyceae cyanobacterium]